MSDFPRGWTFSNRSAGGTASVTVAAVVGVVHVLDSFDAVLTATAAVAFPVDTQVQLSSSDGVFAGFNLAEMFLAAAGKDTAGASGLDLAAGPGASLTITFASGAANINELLLVQGHDI